MFKQQFPCFVKPEVPFPNTIFVNDAFLLYHSFYLITMHNLNWTVIRFYPLQWILSGFTYFPSKACLEHHRSPLQKLKRNSSRALQSEEKLQLLSLVVSDLAKCIKLRMVALKATNCNYLNQCYHFCRTSPCDGL